MNQDILINTTTAETRVAVLENRRIEEIYIERQSNLGLVGNIYLGKVVRVLPGMQSAFIEIGLERTAFLRGGHGDLPPTAQPPVKRPHRILYHR